MTPAAKTKHDDKHHDEAEDTHEQAPKAKAKAAPEPPPAGHAADGRVQCPNCGFYVETK